MIVVDSTSRAPGSCAVLRTSTGPFIDTLIDFDDLPTFGRLYLSFDAISTMAQMFGMLPAGSVARITAERDEARAETARVRAELDALTAVKAVLDSYTPEDPMSRMPTPTELAHANAIAEAFDEPEPPLAPDDDTPEGAPLDDSLAALLLVDPDAIAVLSAYYGAEPETLADLIDLDPPPDLVDGIMEWVDAVQHPVIRAVRRDIAVAVERAKSESAQRKSILALATEVPA